MVLETNKIEGNSPGLVVHRRLWLDKRLSISVSDRIREIIFVEHSVSYSGLNSDTPLPDKTIVRVGKDGLHRPKFLES